MYIYSDYYIILWNDTKTNTEFIKCIKHLPLDYKQGFINNYQHQILGIFLIKDSYFYSLEEYLHYCSHKTTVTKCKRNILIDYIITKLENIKKK